MDQIDLSILRCIRDTNAERRVPVVSLEEAFPDARVEERLPGLWNRGLLVVYGFHRTEQWSVFITVDGLRTLAAEEQLAQEVAESNPEDGGHHRAGHERAHEHAQKKSFRQKLVDCILLAAAIATILGFLFQYRDMILRFFAQLLKLPK